MSGGSSILRSLKINEPNRRPVSSGVFFRHFAVGSRLANIGIASLPTVVAAEAPQIIVAKAAGGYYAPVCRSAEALHPRPDPSQTNRLEIFAIFLMGMSPVGPQAMSELSSQSVEQRTLPAAFDQTGL